MPLVTTPGWSERRYSALGPSPLSLKGICFRLRMMSVASSTTPVIDWNSCSTPSILTAVTAAPSMDESSVRRSALPMVVPKPRSKGWALNLPYFSVSVSVSTARRFGFWNPLQSISVFLSMQRRREAFCYARACFSSLIESVLSYLLAIQFDDQLLVYGQIHVFTLGQRQYLAGQICVIHLQPAGRYLVAREFRRGFEYCEFLAAFADLDLVADTYLERRNVHLAAIHFHMAVAHDLARLAPRAGKPEAEGHVVETTLELLQEQFAGDALGPRCLLVIGAELALQGEINALGLLLFAQLQTIAYDLGLAVAAVLAGSKVALFNGALLGKALGAFQKELHAFATAKAADWSGISCHVILLASEADRFTDSILRPGPAKLLYAPAFGRTATIVWDRRNVTDR